MTQRLNILKTFKLYINGNFSRSESGRYYLPKNKAGQSLANCCLASRKDFRNAVQSARKAQDAWANRSAYNIGQILYRIAENLESRKVELSNIISKESSLSKKKTDQEVETAVDIMVYFAGWADKFQQVFSQVNPVASSHFNFSIFEPSGIVAVLNDNNTSFVDLITAIASTLCGGNASVILAAENKPLSAITFAEVLHHSDLPAGVVNLLTGNKNELAPHFASHKDVNSLLMIGNDFEVKKIKETACENLKRVIQWSKDSKESSVKPSPALIKSFMEVKTTWHPIEQIGPGATAY